MQHCVKLLTTASILLAPSLQADFSADADQGTISLEKMEVTGQRAESKYYQVTESLSATKTPTALLDIPQSISIVTAEQIKDQQMLSLADVVLYLPGITAHQGENNRDQIVFRGNSSSADFFLNGVRDDVQYYRDLYNLNRVEVLRGPTAMIFGRGNGGGLINRETKEAGFAPSDEITIQAGSHDSRRATLDVNRPWSDRLAFRLNALHEDSASFRDHVDLQRSAINPTLTFVPAAHTKITFSYEHLHDFRVADRGITSFRGRPVDMPVSTYYGDPADSQVRAEVNFLSATVEHRAGDLLLHNRTLFGDYDRGYQNYVPGAVDVTQQHVTLTAYNNATRRQNLFNQTDLTYRATTGGIHHQLLGGLELGRQHTDNFRNTGYFGNTAMSIQVPYDQPTINSPATFRQSATDANNHLTANLAAVYGQDQIEISRSWLAIVGLRFDSFDLGYRNNRNGDALRRRDELLSPRAGLIFKPVNQVSLYANYSVSYLPSSGDQFSSLTVVTQQVKPEKFTSHELGVKWDLTPRLSLTSAAYQLDRTNTRSTDPVDPTRMVQTGSTRTQGFELGLNGSMTRTWSVAGGYAWQDARIRSATISAPAGAHVPQVPAHSFSLWNRWNLSGKFGIGVGAIYRSAMYAAIDNKVTLPGYTRMDAAVYYAFNPRWRLQANVENLLNRRYFINADSNTNISPGSPIAVRVMLRTNF
ncbi:MAG TPA: TonB-dependent siderophore receptor [Lacunisphaera sp.]|nr:TonB-dependent siderophore receptor [Lacunisphaera sp.]